MRIETDIEGNNIERKRRNASDYLSDQGLVVPDMMSGQSNWLDVGLKVLNPSLEVSKPLEYILSEFDPSRRSQLRALYARRESLKEQLAALQEKISVKAFRSLRDLRTRGKRIISVVKGWKQISAYEWSSIHGHWKTIQDEEYVDETTFCERLLKYAHLSPSARKSVQQRLRHSRLRDEKYRKHGWTIPRVFVWRSNPRKIKVKAIPIFDMYGQPISPKENLHERAMLPIPIYGSKAVPDIDWDAVRREWALRLEKLGPERDRLIKAIEDVNQKMIDIRPQSAHIFNRCVQVSGQGIARVPLRNVSLLTGAIGQNLFPRIFLENEPSTGGNSFPGLAGDGALYTTSKTFVCSDVCSTTEEFLSLLRSMSEAAERYHQTGSYPVVPDDWSEVVDMRYTPTGQQWARIVIGRSAEIRYHNDYSTSDYHPLVSRLEGGLAMAPIRLKDNLSPREVDEKAQSALNALLAGRASGSTDTSFNFARSLGELKDLPQTASQSTRFLTWLRAKGVKGGCEKLTVSGLKCPVYVWKGNLPAFLTVNNGKRAILKRTLVRAPSLAMLASAYLGWKFAIQPTIADARRLSDETLSDLMASRRYITRLYRLLDTRTKYVVLRKGFLVGKPLKRDKPVLVESNDLPAAAPFWSDSWSLSKDQLISIMRFDASPFDVAVLGEGQEQLEVPYLTTTAGLRVYLPFDRSGRALVATERTRCAEDSWRRGLNVLPPEFFAYPLLYRSWVKGCVFARYGRNALRNLAQDRSLASKLDRLKIAKTLWDLSPLSFLDEWFSNLGDIVQNAQDIASADTVGIQPIGGPWKALTERFAFSRAVVPQRFQLVQRTVKAVYRPVLRVTGPRPGRTFWASEVDLAPVHIAWEWAVRDTLTGRRVSRKEWLAAVLPRLESSSVAVENRSPIVWERELPSFRPSLRLDYGKGLTLLAMYLANS